MTRRTTTTVATGSTTTTTKPQPLCRVSDEFGDPLKDEVLQDIAGCFAYVDEALLEFVDRELEDIVAMSRRGLIRRNKNCEKIARDRAAISQIMGQIRDVQVAKRRFCTAYLQEISTLDFWISARRHLKSRFDALHKAAKLEESDFLREAKRIQNGIYSVMIHLPNRFRHAVTQASLDEGERRAIRLRWIELDGLFIVLNEYTSLNRGWSSWLAVQSSMDTAGKDKVSISASTRRKSVTVTYWTTVTVVVIISFLLLVKAYRCSPHNHGTSADADFWLLLQASGIQMLNLGVSGYAVTQDHSIFKFDRLFLLSGASVGSMFSLAACILYTKAPTEWSAFMGSFAGFVQAFIQAQLLLEKKMKQD